jgi:hypothetical protein
MGMKKRTAYQRLTLVLGAGELGMSVLRSLALLAEPGSVAVLLRPERGKSFNEAKQKNIKEIQSLGVTVVSGDLANLSVAELAEVFSPYDTLVSCTGFVGGSGTQRKIAEAALLAGITRYVPWQFGVDYDVIGRGSAQDLFDEQLDVRNLLRSQTQTQWVIVSTGLFTSFLFEPAFGVFDLEQETVHGLGSWDNAVTLTTAEDVGRLTAEVLTAEPAIVNQVVFVAGDTVTYGQAADLVEQIMGKQLKREVWTVPQLRAQLAKDAASSIAKYRVVFAEGRGVSWPYTGTFNQQHRIPVTDLRQWLTNQRADFAHD